MTPKRAINAAIGATALAVLMAGLGTAGPGAEAAAITGTATGTFVLPTDYTPAMTKGTDHDFAQVIYRGDLTGTAIDYGTFKPGANSGSGNEYCVVCIMDGKKGGYTATYQFSGNSPGTITFTRGFGGLTGLEGGGTFTSKGGYTYHYSLP